MDDASSVWGGVREKILVWSKHKFGSYWQRHEGIIGSIISYLKHVTHAKWVVGEEDIIGALIGHMPNDYNIFP